MNGVRTTFMRRGYMLTALSALLLLAASSGTASAQSVGFVGSSGTLAEAASFESGAFEGPHAITVKGTGIPESQRARILGNLALTVTGTGRYAIVNPEGGLSVIPTPLPTGGESINLTFAQFNDNDEATLLVVQGATDGARDNNWHDERITFTLTGSAATSISQNVYAVMVDDSHVAPVATFSAPSFTLTEGSDRAVSLDIVSGTTGRADITIPSVLFSGQDGTVAVGVSNHQMVTIGGPTDGCAPPASSGGNLHGQTRKAIHIALGSEWGDVNSGRVGEFGRTARLSTASTGGTISDLVGTNGDGAAAGMTITACDVSGFRNQSITLTILEGTPGAGRLVELPHLASRGDIAIGPPLMVTVDSNEAAPTLSFSPTDVTIDEGDSVSTRLIADGMSATEVGMVKLMVEGDAMVDLYHEDTMLEEMDGYVMVDMGRSNSARLTAMSMESRELQDGDMAYKAWKLVDGSSDAMIGDDSWFRVDVRGSTAVPALPLIGQLLLALFLMAGGSKLYRRRRG